MSDIKLVIFDCDGVLVDSEIIACRIENKVYADLGFKLDEQEFIERFAGLTSVEIKRAVEDELGYELPHTLLDEFKFLIDEELEKSVEMIAGADEAIRSIELSKCICSNSRMNRLDITLQKTGLKPLFNNQVYSAQDLEGVDVKPAPDVFLRAISDFEVTPKETIVIEDSVHGIHGAVAAGARVVGFTGGSHSWPSHADALTEAGAETVIRRLADFPDLIPVMGQWDGLA